jgi:hypothetical protein
LMALQHFTYLSKFTHDSIHKADQQFRCKMLNLQKLDYKDSRIVPPTIAFTQCNHLTAPIAARCLIKGDQLQFISVLPH